MRLRRAASGPKSLPFRAVLRKATAWMSSCKIFAKRLKDVFRLKSPRPNRAAPNGCWNCLHEILIRPRLRSYRRASWLDPASRKWQSSYLRQEWKRRAAFPIPIHGNKPLKTGLLRHLAKLAEISDDDF